ncbi:unnamed protein product, partial [Ectocarpus sp. 12 AP-2014]
MSVSHSCALPYFCTHITRMKWPYRSPRHNSLQTAELCVAETSRRRRCDRHLAERALHACHTSHHWEAETGGAVQRSGISGQCTVGRRCFRTHWGAPPLAAAAGAAAAAARALYQCHGDHHDRE